LDGSINTPSVDIDKTALDALELFQAALPAEFFERQRKAAGQRPEKGIYTAAVVVLLVILQRLLQGKGTLSGAVQQVLSGRLNGLLPRHKRIQEDSLSGNTGAYSRARCRLPKSVVEKAADQVVEYLLADPKEALPGLGRQAFLLDGSSVKLPHTEELLKVYPPASNRHGESHWPVMRVVVAHDLVSGIALRPAWGPMYGTQAVSEQALAEQIIDRLGAGSILVLDRNFGVFSVVWYASGKNHPIVVRMTDARARSLNRGKLPSEADEWIDWKPSRWDRRAHPNLPGDACIRVRFIATRVLCKGKPIQLYLVTTLNLPVPPIVELYGFRWNIGVSSQGHIVQSVRDRPGLRDSSLVAWEEPRSGPALAEANRALAFAPFHHAGHGGQRTDTGSNGLQLRPGSDLGCCPSGESEPPPNQFFPGARRSQRVSSQPASGSYGTGVCDRIGANAAPHRPVQTSANQTSAKLPQSRLATRQRISEKA